MIPEMNQCGVLILHNKAFKKHNIVLKFKYSEMFYENVETIDIWLSKLVNPEW